MEELKKSLISEMVDPKQSNVPFSVKKIEFNSDLDVIKKTIPEIYHQVKKVL